MRGPAHLVKLLAALVLAAAPAVQADQIALRETPKLRPAEEGLALVADFSLEVPPRIAEAVANGVPLYFLLEFELTRPRWYWLDEKVAARRAHLRLSYHALSRQYRLSSGPLQQSFATLGEALHVLGRVRGWIVVERTVVLVDADYEAAVRLRLDVTQLPRPFQLDALTSREWSLDSGWKRFTAHSPQHAPAPVESREPREAEAR